MCDNLSSLADHSHFQRVIDHLQQVAAQEKQNSCRDDSIELTGDEEDLDPEINVCCLFFFVFILEH